MHARTKKVINPQRENNGQDNNGGHMPNHAKAQE